MIMSCQGETHIQGAKLDVIFEFDEIMRIMIKNHPEIVQASSILYADDLLNAHVDKETYILVEKLLTQKHEMHDNGDFCDEDSML